MDVVNEGGRNAGSPLDTAVIFNPRGGRPRLRVTDKDSKLLLMMRLGGLPSSYSLHGAKTSGIGAEGFACSSGCGKMVALVVVGGAHDG